MTQEDHPHTERIPTFLSSGRLAMAAEVPAFDPELDRVLMCGNEGFNSSLEDVLCQAGMTLGLGTEKDGRQGGYCREIAHKGLGLGYDEEN